MYFKSETTSCSCATKIAKFGLDIHQHYVKSFMNSTEVVQATLGERQRDREHSEWKIHNDKPVGISFCVVVV